MSFHSHSIIAPLNFLSFMSDYVNSFKTNKQAIRFLKATCFYVFYDGKKMFSMVMLVRNKGSSFLS